MSENKTGNSDATSLQKGASPKSIVEGASPKEVQSGQRGASPSTQTTESKPPPNK